MKQPSFMQLLGLWEAVESMLGKKYYCGDSDAY